MSQPSTFKKSADEISYATQQLTSSDYYFALHKAATTIAYLLLLVLTWRFLTHKLDWRLAVGCNILSGAWLVLIRLKMSTFLKTYFDVFSRLEIIVPTCIGILLSTVGLFAHSLLPLHLISLSQVVLWIWVYVVYNQNRKEYITQGHGPVPRGTWVNPPDSVLKPGDLLLTSGNIATQLHESVGHAATVVRLEDGSMKVLSSHMDRGTTLEPLQTMTSEQKEKGHYIALRLKKTISEDQIAEMAKFAKAMVAENKKWKKERNEQTEKIVAALPISAKLKEKLNKQFYASGYDWFGTFMGRIAQHHWTCIGAGLELYHRLGIKTRPYGTGLLGFGTTLFDPIMPVRFLSDPAFEVIKKDPTVATDTEPEKKITA